MKRALEDEIGIIIVKHLGSKNSSYPDDSFESRSSLSWLRTSPGI